MAALYLLLVAIASWSGQSQPPPSEAEAGFKQCEELLKTAHYAQVEKIAGHLLELSRKNDDKKGAARALNYIGAAQYYTNHIDEALATFEQVVQLAAQAGNRRMTAVAANNVGNALRSAGRFDEAAHYLNISLEYYRSTGDEKREALQSRTNAILYGEMGDREKAEQLFERSIQLSRKLGEKQTEQLALLGLGILHREMGRGEIALKEIQTAAALIPHPPDALLRVEIRSSLASAYCDLHELTKCIEIAREARAEAVADGAQPDIALNDQKIGNAQREQGDLAASLATLTQARDEMQAVGYFPQHEWPVHMSLGQTLRALGRNQEALASYRRAIALVEEMRTHSIPNERSRAAMSANTHELFEQTIDLMFAMGKREEALHMAEASHARAFLAMLAESRIDLRAGISPALRKREDGLLERINEAEKRLQHRDLPAAGRRAAQAELNAAESDLENVRVDIRAENPRFADLQYAQPLDAPGIRKALPDARTAVVEYTLGPARSFAWAVTKTGMLALTLPRQSEIDRLVSAYRSEIARPVSSLTLAAGQAELRQAGDRLYAAVFRPIEPALAGIRRIIVIPDGALYFIPFDALPDARGGRLLDRFGVSYTPSATSLGEIRRPSGAPLRTLLAVGDPTYAPDRGLPPLPYTRKEVMELARLFPKADRTVLVGDEASEQKFESLPLDRYGLIHIAAHGIFNEQYPSRSGIALAASPREDGVLQVGEIVHLRLSARVVTLSACNTALGKLVTGEGMLGLTRAFLYAGASRVAVSLWNVDDGSTAELMKGFYENLNRGLAPAEALRQAKLRMLRQGDALWRNPHFWAAFTLWE
jgi:CHAT domain-containing protein/tetratricopeptide (TPR) repeat protein